MNLEELEVAAAQCELCNLNEGRNKAVFAKGNPESGVMICGMVPADEENKAGIPFVGRAGKLLDTILEDSGLGLSSVYITNLVKCYLAAGKLLQQDWIDACLPYLVAQIGMIRPKAIITLGKDASVSVLGLDNKVALGTIRKKKVYPYGKDTVVIPTYHPSYLLRGGGTKHKAYEDVVSDFKFAKKASTQ